MDACNSLVPEVLPKGLKDGSFLKQLLLLNFGPVMLLGTLQLFKYWRFYKQPHIVRQLFETLIGFTDDNQLPATCKFNATLGSCMMNYLSTILFIIFSIRKKTLVCYPTFPLSFYLFFGYWNWQVPEIIGCFVGIFIVCCSRSSPNLPSIVKFCQMVFVVSFWHWGFSCCIFCDLVVQGMPKQTLWYTCVKRMTDFKILLN